MIRKYYYLFYTFFTLFEKAFPHKTASNHYRAIMIILMLELWLLFALLNLRDVFVGETSIRFSSPELLAPLLLIIGLNAVVFIFNDNWKRYNKQFENLPVGQNDQGLRIVLGLSIFIICLLVISIFLHSSSFQTIKY